MGEIERAETNPSATSQLNIALALRVEVAELFPKLTELMAQDQDLEGPPVAAVPKRAKRGTKRATPGGETFSLREAQERLRAEGRETEGKAETTSASSGRTEGFRSGAADRERARERRANSKFVGTEAAAKLFGVHQRTIERWLADGKLQADYVDGRDAVFVREEIERLAELYRRERETHEKGESDVSADPPGTR